MSHKQKLLLIAFSLLLSLSLSSLPLMSQSIFKPSRDDMLFFLGESSAGSKTAPQQVVYLPTGIAGDWEDISLKKYNEMISSLHLTSSDPNDNSNQKEIGVEWINKYPYLGKDFDSHCSRCAKGFYNILGDEGFTQVFDKGDKKAWESHFEKSAVGGEDYNYIDAIDYAFFAGHGNTSSLIFRQDTSGYDGDDMYVRQAHYSEVKWGDGDLEWIALVACHVLNVMHRDDWIRNAFDDDHLHGIVGFTDNVPSWQIDDLGEYFATYLYNGDSFKEAWKKATNKVFTGDVAPTAAILYPKVWYDPPIGPRGVWKDYSDECLVGRGSGSYPDPSEYTDDPYKYVLYYCDTWVT